MMRWEILEFLKEVLRLCGDELVVEMVWLRGLESEPLNDDAYQLVLKAILDEAAIECLKPIVQRFGMRMKQEDGNWVFTKSKNSSKRVFFASIT